MTGSFLSSCNEYNISLINICFFLTELSPPLYVEITASLFGNKDALGLYPGGAENPPLYVEIDALLLGNNDAVGLYPDGIFPPFIAPPLIRVIEPPASGSRDTEGLYPSILSYHSF